MNRRDFVKMSVAALFLPSLIVRPKLDLHRIVAGFCDSEGVTSRYDLSLPFVQNRTAFGTDGRIMAWIPTVDSDTSKETRAIPNALAVQSTLWKENGRWQKMPTPRLVGEASINCPLCSRNHYCRFCDPDSEEFGMYEPGPCPKCGDLDYIPQPDCWICHGNRKKAAYQSRVLFGDKCVSIHYHQKIAAIPGVMWNVGGDAMDPEQWGKSFGPCEPILFRSDLGISGMVMPMTR